MSENFWQVIEKALHSKAFYYYPGWWQVGWVEANDVTISCRRTWCFHCH